MVTSMFNSLVDSLCSAVAFIVRFIYTFNLVNLALDKIGAILDAVNNGIFSAISSVVNAILTPFVLLFRLFNYVSGVLYYAITTAVHATILTIFNFLFTYEHSDADSWSEFLLNLRPTFNLVSFLVVILIWQRITSRRPLKKKIEELEEKLKDLRIEMSHTHITRLLEFVFREASLHIEKTMSVPDVNTTFDVPLTTCNLTALDGVMEGVNSLFVERTVTSWQNGKLVLEVTAGLKGVQLYYGRYSLQAPLDPLPPFYVSGDVKISVSPIILKVKLVLQSPFEAQLRSLEVWRLGHLKVEPTGLGAWDFLWRATSWIAWPSMCRELKTQIELRGRPIFEDVLRKVNSVLADLPVIKLDSFKAGTDMELALAPRETLTPGYLLAIGAIITAAAAVLFRLPFSR